MLDGFQGLGRQALAINIQLNTPTDILQNQERAAVEHDTTGDLGRDRCFLQLRLGLVRVGFLQIGAVAVTTEIIGKYTALGALVGELFLAHGNQAVFFLVTGVRVLRLVGHVCVFLGVSKVSRWCDGPAPPERRPAFRAPVSGWLR